MPPLTTWLSWLFCLVCVIASMEIATSSAYTWLQHDATITKVPDQGYIGVQHDAVRHYYPGRQRRIVLSFLLGVVGGGSSFVVGLVAWQRQYPMSSVGDNQSREGDHLSMSMLPPVSAPTLADTLVAVAKQKLNHPRSVSWPFPPTVTKVPQPAPSTVVPSEAELNALAQSLSQELNLAPSISTVQERIQVPAKGKPVEQVLALAGLPERLVLPGHPDWPHLVGQYPHSGHPWFNRALSRPQLLEALKPYFSGPYEWLKYAINAGLLIVTGSQGASKTTLIAFICRIRTLLLGHDLHIIDRHVRLGQWQPYDVFGYGATRPEQEQSVIAGVRQFKAAIAHSEQVVKTTADPQLLRTTYVFEELLEWRDFVPEELVRTVFTDISAAIRKACKSVILASQGGTLETWGGGKALAGLREVLDESSVQIHLHTRPGDLFLREAEFVPTFSGQIRICNGDWQDIHLPAWFFVPQDFLDLADPTVQAQCLAQLQAHHFQSQGSNRSPHLKIVQ